MSSVEECDETKACETVDLMEDTQKGSFDDNDTEFKSYIDTESSSDGNDENEESEHSLICTTFNFDELFNKKININEKCIEEGLPQTSSGATLDQSTDIFQEKKQNFIEKNDTSNLPPNKPTSFAQELKSEFCIPIATSETSNDLNSNKINVLGKPAGFNISANDSLHLDDYMGTGFSVLQSRDTAIINSDIDKHSTTHTDNQEQHPKESVSLTENTTYLSILNKAEISFQSDTEETEHGFKKENNVDGSEILTDNVLSKTNAPIATDPQKVLEMKLANLLPKLPINASFDSSLPDLTVVTSIDAAINSIREKYANLAQSDTTKTENEVPVKNEFQNIKSLQFPNSLLTDYTHDSAKPITNILSAKVVQNSQEELFKENITEKVQENVFELESKPILLLHSLASKQDAITDDASEFPNKQELEINLDSSNELDFDTSLSADKDLVSETNDEAIINKLLTEEQQFEDFINKPPTSSTRRGSEVALNLILQENSQILSKIHQQSRRSSEISISSKHLLENDEHNEIDPGQKTEDMINLKEEIMQLNKTIYLDENIEILPQYTSSADSGYKSVASDENSSKQELLSRTMNLSEKNEEQQFIISAVSKEITNAQEPSNVYPLSLCGSEGDKESLPDVCKFDRELNKSSKYEDSNKNASVIDCCSHKYQPYTPFELSKESQSISTDTCPEGFDRDLHSVTVSGFTEPYRHTKRASIMSPTKELEENSPLEARPTNVKETLYGDECAVAILKCTDNPQEVGKKAMLYGYNEVYKSEVSKIKCSPDTNEDILKELRYLDIKPEETLDYSDPKSESLSPVKPSDSYYLFRENNPTRTTPDLPSSADQQHSFTPNQHPLFDYSPDARASRSIFRKSYKNHKATSVDSASLDKIMNDKYLDETCKSLVRSATVIDDDNSLYMNSYKNHGRLLMDKGELDTCISLDKHGTNSNQEWYNDRKPLDSSDGSAYDITKPSSTKMNPSYSQFLSKDSNSLDDREIERREKLLFKYKSEDLGRSVSPSRYRFSSASPIRQRLDTLTPYSINRTKSPSPTGYNRSSLALASGKSTTFDSSVSQSSGYGSSKEYKQCSKTESLDLSQSSDRHAGFLRKRAESFETSTWDKFSEEKKPLSPSSPIKFNPFPVRSSSRQPKELGVKLGLYLPPKSDKSPSKHMT
uniref:Uncharacterized protein n=1 Tax=Graphocephala atropunctata TaxID=36148 RepID=A0A1B6LH54_9HEMI